MAQQSVVSQPVITKGGTQSSDPRNGSSRPVNGPQSKTESTPFEFNDLRFPPNVGTVDKHLHWIKFIPNVQNKSGYNVKKATGPSGGELLSRVDSNRLQTGGQLGSKSDYFDSALGAVGGGAALAGIYGVINGVGKALDAADAPGASVGSVAASGAGGALAGVLTGAFAGAVVSAIDLTRKTRRAAGSIGLYMPDTVNQTVVNDYDQVSLTQALGTAGLILQSGGAITEGVVGQVMDGKNFGQTTGSAALSELAGAAAEKTGAFGQGITDVLLFSAGYAQNPQVELLFKTIQNREFLFDFKFVPRNKAEAESIIKIIQTFRFFAAPEIPKTGNGRYFIPPSEFDIIFMLGSARNPNLPQISTCVLQGIDVNYGSAGQWTAFKDGMPVEISMQLRFKEIEIMHKELITKGY
jgi:hypothetical protein